MCKCLTLFLFVMLLDLQMSYDQIKNCVLAKIEKNIEAERQKLKMLLSIALSRFIAIKGGIS